MVALIIWAVHAREEEPHIILQECTAMFDVRVLERLLSDMYCIMKSQLDPNQFGLPAKRPRSYMVFVHREKMQASRFRFGDQDFESTFFRRCVTSADLYFSAPADDRASIVSDMAANRNLPREPPDSFGDRVWKLSHVLPPGMRLRLEQARTLARDRTENVLVANIMQSVDRAQICNVMPTLMTNSMCVLIRGAQNKFQWCGGCAEGVLLTPDEHLQVMGWPLANCADEGTPQMPKELAKLSSSKKKRVAGNGMHMAVVGSLLIYALCSHDMVGDDPHEMRTPEKRSRGASSRFWPDAPDRIEVPDAPDRIEVAE